ncbi:MAG TPA: CHAD domain-containing protein [Steroidobacteraceae bacterium]|nr:CHAD domain-containing protein [Steroidobacteraceae bacterium]
MIENTEQEWQFTAPALDSARAWLAAQPHEVSDRRLTIRPTLELTDTYYDSPDWMIFRAGFALRMRQERADAGDEQTQVTLKSLNAPRDGLAQRTELSQRTDGADMNAVVATTGIGERIRELIGERPLAPLFKARTRRERRQLLEADSDLALAEVDLDETSIDAPSGTSLQLKRVEVECINATPAALESFVAQLRDAANLQPVETSKFRAGLDAAGLDPLAAAPAGDVEIRAAQSFAATQFALLRTYFARVLEEEPSVRAGSVESVHQMRVATRHLDVLLRVFTGFGPRWAVGSRKILRALIDALGAVRDCDVQLHFLRGSSSDFTGADRAAIEPLRERLTERRAGARTRLLRLLDSNRMHTWVTHWQDQLRLGTASSARSREVITANVARELIRHAAGKLHKHADRLNDDSTADDFHRVRIRAKRLRYTLDAFGSLYGGAAREYLDALAKLQHVLGEYHDSTVRAGLFTELVTSGRLVPAATSFLVGRLVERDQSDCRKCQRKFSKAYRRIKRRRWRELLSAMREQARAADQMAGGAGVV